MNILIIGATSAIAEHFARLYAKDKAGFFLIGRNLERLNVISQDLIVRGATKAMCQSLEINELSKHASVLDAAWQTLGHVDIVLVAHGTLPDNVRCDVDAAYAVQEFNTNATATIHLLALLANRLEQQGHGKLAVITSVAGDRGRASNALYGSAKAAVSTYLSALRQRLWRSGVSVTDIRPGFIDTPMTISFKKGLLWSQPGRIAPALRKAVDRQAATAYVPGFWWLIMLIIRMLPQFIFRRLKL